MSAVQIIYAAAEDAQNGRLSDEELLTQLEEAGRKLEDDSQLQTAEQLLKSKCARRPQTQMDASVTHFVCHKITICHMTTTTLASSCTLLHHRTLVFANTWQAA